MRVPRDLGGEELAQRLSRYGYSITRQTGSHLRLTSTLKGAEHHISIPRHKPLRVGTLNNILKDVAAYLEMNKQELIQELFQG
ncbi:MAG: type II toxin-antitoxin system HicA family toxin [Candidatus Caldarchaeum sp.]